MHSVTRLLMDPWNGFHTERYDSNACSKALEMSAEAAAQGDGQQSLRLLAAASGLALNEDDRLWGGRHKGPEQFVPVECVLEELARLANATHAC